MMAKPHDADLDNAISLQGMSDRVVVMAFPKVETYTAVVVRDKYFVDMMLSWFTQRFETVVSDSGRPPEGLHWLGMHVKKRYSCRAVRFENVGINV